MRRVSLGQPENKPADFAIKTTEKLQRATGVDAPVRPKTNRETGLLKRQKKGSQFAAIENGNTKRGLKNACFYSRKWVTAKP